MSHASCAAVFRGCSVRCPQRIGGVRRLSAGDSGPYSDLWMEDYPVAPIRQRLAMRRDNRDAGLLMQPGVRGSDAGF